MTEAAVSPTAASTGTTRVSHGIVAAALVVVTVVAYLPALAGEFVWDDDDYVSQNATLRSVEGLKAIWLDPSATPQYYPLVHTAFWVEYQLWGLNPRGYHVTNLLLHLASAFLVWRLARVLAIPGAAVIAAIFAVHPVHVESVAWITERKNVLSGVFYLSAMLVYLRFALESGSPSPRRRWTRYFVSLALFAAGLLSKTVTASLPAALLVLISWRRGGLARRDVWPLIPMFVAGTMLGSLTIWLERTHVGAQGIDWQLTPVERAVIAGRALWFYASKLLWPTGLAFMYPRWSVAATGGQLLFPISAAAMVVALWLARRRVGASALVGVVLFVGTLVPALGFFDVFPMRYTFVADHYQYLASLALIALVVAAAAAGLQALRVPIQLQRALATAVVMVLAGLTWQRSHAFETHEALWRDSVENAPGSWMGQVSLGALLERRGAVEEAEFHYRESVRLNPDFAIARVNLAALLANQGRLAEAVPHFRAAVRLDPASLDSHTSLGRALLYLGRTDEAATWLAAAAERWPDQPELRALLEQARRRSGRSPSAPDRR